MNINNVSNCWSVADFLNFCPSPARKPGFSPVLFVSKSCLINTSKDKYWWNVLYLSTNWRPTYYVFWYCGTWALFWGTWSTYLEHLEHSFVTLLRHLGHLIGALEALVWGTWSTLLVFGALGAHDWGTGGTRLWLLGVSTPGPPQLPWLGEGRNPITSLWFTLPGCKFRVIGYLSTSDLPPKARALGVSYSYETLLTSPILAVST